jgi:hypothetical protein
MPLRMASYARLMITALGVSAVWTAGLAAFGVAQNVFPWCSQGDILHCYYRTREQCEITVDYHGFCVANPEAPS